MKIKQLTIKVAVILGVIAGCVVIAHIAGALAFISMPAYVENATDGQVTAELQIEFQSNPLVMGAVICFLLAGGAFVYGLVQLAKG